VSANMPSSLARLLEAVTTKKKALDVVVAARQLLELSEKLGDVARSFEAFREVARALGLFEETRSGQRVLDSWSKVTSFFGELTRSRANFLLNGSGGDLRPAPAGFESIGARWERTLPEIEGFAEEERAIERSLAEQPVSANVSFPFRSRLLLLDRRAERIKVACDLLRRDIAAAAKGGLDRLGDSGHGAEGGDA
jgi:hypothetical protein